jgi:hydroxymethylglutaryl-CoA reductase
MSSNENGRCSRLPGFYKLSLEERRARLAEACELGPVDTAHLAAATPLDCATADHMIENVIGTYALPLGVGLNFQINGRDYLVPMVVEEPSVVAAASNAARMIREGGGFQAEADDPIMIAQVQLTEVADPEHAKRRIDAHANEIVAAANAAQPGLCARGGGARGIEVRILAEPSERESGMLVVHLHVDCRDAMGANLVNTMAERVADRLAELSSGRVGLRILSNLADRRCVRARGRIPFAALASEKDGQEGAEVARGIASASRFAELDPYRAATHNKGIMNGVDAVVIACGNDWRGIEAGAHAWAARNGSYGPLTTWTLDGDALRGAIELPLAVATVGGHLELNPRARLSLRVLGAASARDLAAVMAAVGLGQNLAALRALVTEGIQRGHMALHARGLALRARASS